MTFWQARGSTKVTNGNNELQDELLRSLFNAVFYCRSHQYVLFRTVAKAYVQNV
jgi:hypothetical protein